MAVLSELRYPTTRAAKVVSGLLALILFVVVALASISGFLLYQVLKPARTPSSFDLNVMMGHPTTFSVRLPDGTSQDGWFFPGLRGAPTIIVSHGYSSQRSDVLTLAAAIQQHEFNAFVFDYAGHGSNAGTTTLGYTEAGELEAAVKALAGRDDVDQQNFGLWGVDLGAYASLAVASSDSRIRALVVDDPYDSPKDLLDIEVKNSGLTALPFVGRFCDFGFRMLNYQDKTVPPLSAHIAATRGVPKLFIQSDGNATLARDTAALYNIAPDPKQLTEDSVSYRDMSDDDRKNYENRVSNFFSQYLPLR
ncbi:MAG: alpha/beta hydrolase [Candidatus Acidiferrales bacterium]